MMEHTLSDRNAPDVRERNPAIIFFKFLASDFILRRISPLHLEYCQRVDSPGIKLNIKVAIFNSHLAPIYYMRVKKYDYMWLSGNRSDKVCKMYKYRMDT
jgi:hypothetical protein